MQNETKNLTIWFGILTNMNDETMKNEKNSGVSDAAVSETPPVHSYCEFKQIAFRPGFSQLLPCFGILSQQASNLLKSFLRPDQVLSQSELSVLA